MLNETRHFTIQGKGKKSGALAKVTGTSEACARSVFMFVCTDDAESESGGDFSAASN
jgi:hypothetical protein